MHKRAVRGWRNRTLTVWLSKTLLKKAKALAAKRETSLNQLIRMTLEEEVEKTTNILIYACDEPAACKREIARRRVTDSRESGQGVLSTQVLREFFVTATGKIEKPLLTDAAKGIVSDLLRQVKA